MTDSTLTSKIAGLLDRKMYDDLHWEGTFEDYLKIVGENPLVTRNAFQRVYDMIRSYGVEDYKYCKKSVKKYNFFTDKKLNGEDAIFGLDQSLMDLVTVLKAAAHGYGPEKRVLLLHGPVGSAKSTIVRLMKKGLEKYSRTPEGAIYSYRWIKEGDSDHSRATDDLVCPMNEDPLHLVPFELRSELEKELNIGGKDFKVKIEGDLCPACRYMYRELNRKYKGDWTKIMSHIRVSRLVLSEQDRIGIGTFQPKDEKNQDSTELTGDINYRKIATYGSDSDPRAFDFNGEFNIANRGIIEFIEVLKLDVAFLYDLLSASQEHKIKPKKFAQTDIDEVIIGHTNEPEFRKLQSNEFMEALRDRTVKIDIPYVLTLNDEIKIYQKDFGEGCVENIHIAPHTVEMAAMWAVLTRLEEPKKADITLLQKLKLYNGKTLTGYNEENVKEIRSESEYEGMSGISPRYIQDKISNALVKDLNQKCCNPFMVMNELESGLKNHALINSEQELDHYRELLSIVKQEYSEIVKNEVQRAISADEEAITSLCSKYLDNVKAYTQKEKVKNTYTGDLEEPDERLMRSIEEKIDIPESRKDDFRREIMNYIGALAVDGKKFDYRTNERLQRALELKLFEDKKDSIKLATLTSSVVDDDTQKKIDIVKHRLIKDYGYCDVCATDVLNYVASIFARGDAKQE